MATDETTPVAPPAGTPGNTPTQAVTTPPEPLAGDGNETLSLEEARKLRSEAANLRKRLKLIEDEKESARIAAEEATLSEVQKVAKRAETAELRAQEAETQIKQLRAQLVTSETKLIAQGMGFHNPEMTAKVIYDSLEFGEDGKPTNLERALSDLAKNNPFLVKREEPAPSPAQTATPARVAPVTSPFNPGASNTVSRNTLPPGPITLSDPSVFKRPP